ncbi:unnamed protein product, partial [Rotaria magnacalcarata]
STEAETSGKPQSKSVKKPICPQCGSDDIKLSSKYEYEYPNNIRGEMNINADKVRVLRTNSLYSACGSCYYYAATYHFFSTTATDNRFAADDFGCC